ncbi:hypothetical protein BJ875DRAFT_182659 [Amylocarpus encephaloides]|uniref:Uncharacterized protein n=1 Tax=Amylocarpus encephaloides TaxID=45428 RepID=A0A9P7Y9T3_9HELO|nr:hypothetical protein BJ875DRAFT_182659 [Amylocarpus encephaloides]
MQFNVVALALAAMATAVSATTGTITPSGTGTVTGPTSTGSPIANAGASMGGVSAVGIIVAGGVALIL